MPNKARAVVQEVLQEVMRAQKLHPSPQNSLHEGYAVLLEEVDEFKAEVWTNPRKNPTRISNSRAELIQVAAMAVRTIVEVCDGHGER